MLYTSPESVVERREDNGRDVKMNGLVYRTGGKRPVTVWDGDTGGNEDTGCMSQKCECHDGCAVTRLDRVRYEERFRGKMKAWEISRIFRKGG